MKIRNHVSKIIPLVLKLNKHICLAEKKMACVKELVNTSLNDKIYIQEHDGNNHLNEAMNEEPTSKKKGYNDHKERTVTFIDNFEDKLIKSCSDRIYTLPDTSTNYK